MNAWCLKHVILLVYKRLTAPINESFVWSRHLWFIRYTNKIFHPQRSFSLLQSKHP